MGKKKGKAGGGFDTFEMAVAVRAVALMIRSGVPLIDAMEISIEGGFRGRVGDAMSRALAGLRGGKGFAESLRDAGFPRLVVQVAAAGEETAKLDLALDRLADELAARLRRRDGADLGGQSRQMAHLLALTLSMGLPLIQGIEIAAEDCRHPGLRRALLKVKDDISVGAGFGDALAKHPDAFGPYFVAYMRVGERTGSLDKTMERVAGLGDELLELQRHRGKSRMG